MIIISCREMAEIRGQVHYDRDEAALSILKDIFDDEAQGTSEQTQRLEIASKMSNEMMGTNRIPQEFINKFDREYKV